MILGRTSSSLLLRRSRLETPRFKTVKLCLSGLATMTATRAYSRLVRFVPTDTQSNSTTPLIGEPVDTELDVGQATYSSQPVRVHVYSGTSILHPGERTGEEVTVGRLLSPLAASEVGMIRCIGLNYITHAKEVGMEIPTVPTLFTKPDTALAGPWPQKTVIPRSFVQDDAADYEAEVVIVIGKDCKNVSEQDAMDYLLGITAANDVSSRKAQFSQSQWSYSKGFDGACPIGPAFVHKDAIANMTEVKISASLDGKVVQKSDLSDLIFSIPKIISFLSQGTTLRAGTIILTGTPAGIGWTSQPKRTLQHGSTFAVTISHGVGTLINQIEHES